MSHIATLNDVALPRKRFCLPLEWTGHVLIAADVVVACLVGVTTGLAYHRLVLGAPGDPALMLGTSLFVGVFVALTQGFSRETPPSVLTTSRGQISRLFMTWVAAHLLLLMFLFLVKSTETVSRGSMLAFFVFGFAALAALRFYGRRALLAAVDAGMIQSRKVAVLHGGDLNGGDLTSERDVVSELRQYGFRVVHQFRVPPVIERRNAAHLDESMAELIDAIRRFEVEEVLISFSWTNRIGLEALLEALRQTPARVRLLPDDMTRGLLDRPLSKVGTMWTVELQREPLTAPERVIKRTLDLSVASLALLALGPVLAVTALAVRWDSKGPVLFRQQRRGFNGKPFRILKFRSMKVMEDGAVVRQAVKGDTRVTKIGRILRKSSLDELPQLINVLKGDMSIVGPRPHACAHDDEYSQVIAHYAHRHNVKPGITGWAQVHGCRGETPEIDSMKRRIDLDIWYINNWSLWLDVKVMIKTALELRRMPNAY